MQILNRWLCSVVRSFAGQFQGLNLIFLPCNMGPPTYDALDRLHKMRSGTNEEQSHIHVLLLNLHAKASKILNLRI
jgi:hypothetical protein